MFAFEDIILKLKTIISEFITFKSDDMKLLVQHNKFGKLIYRLEPC